MSDSLRPHELQHTRPPCRSATPGVHPNPRPSSRWCHPTISSCCPLLLPPLVFPSIRVFSSGSILPISWPKYWSFSFKISLSNEYSRLTSFRINWLNLLAVQGTLESSPTSQFESINSSVLNLLYGPTLTSIHDYWNDPIHTWLPKMIAITLKLCINFYNCVLSLVSF